VFYISRLHDLSKDKTTILSRLITSQKLCKAVYYDAADFLDQPDLVDPAHLLLNENIYPFRFIPQSSADKKTYITLSFRNYRKVNIAYKYGYICIYIFTHKDLIQTDYEFLRYDLIASEVDELMNNQRGLGIGRTEFEEMDEFIVDEQHMGVYLKYKIYEFS
jgi:hypothetical protein